LTGGGVILPPVLFHDSNQAKKEREND